MKKFQVYIFKRTFLFKHPHFYVGRAAMCQALPCIFCQVTLKTRFSFWFPMSGRKYENHKSFQTFLTIHPMILTVFSKF